MQTIDKETVSSKPEHQKSENHVYDSEYKRYHVKNDHMEVEGYKTIVNLLVENLKWSSYAVFYVFSNNP